MYKKWTDIEDIPANKEFLAVIKTDKFFELRWCTVQRDKTFPFWSRVNPVNGNLKNIKVLYYWI